MNTNGDMAGRDLYRVEPVEHRADDERDVIDEIDEIVAGISDAEVDARLRKFMRRVNGRKLFEGAVTVVVAVKLISDAAEEKDPRTGGVPRTVADRQRTEHDPGLEQQPTGQWR